MIKPAKCKIYVMPLPVISFSIKGTDLLDYSLGSFYENSPVSTMSKKYL